jgi:poly-gamma-glutamate capsule biosynthesis protein CapA/YwtB (metallophosphatase superfamily)
VHGHSSHHPAAIELHGGGVILYGAGDFLNDYEGIRGNESFRPDLALMYFPTLDAPTGRLTRLTLAATQIRHFRSNRARSEDARWLAELLSREGRPFGTHVELQSDGTLALRWGVDRRTPA